MRARAVGSVAVHRSKLPDKPFVEVFWISIADPTVEAGLRRLRYQAASHGCDAVIVNQLDDATRTRTTEYLFDEGERTERSHVTNIRASCIMFEKPPGTWAAAPRVGSCARWRWDMESKSNPAVRRRMAKKMPRRCAKDPSS